MNDSPLSPVECARQVNREGRRFGLSARRLPDGTVKVCDKQAVTECRSGFMQVVKMPRELCTVDDEHPFASALQNRIKNGELDLASRYKAADAKKKAVEQAYVEAYDDHTRQMWRERRRMSMVGGSFVSAGLANRRRR